MMTEYTLPAALVQRIADYLAQRPFAEVFLFLQELIKVIQEQQAAAAAPGGTGSGKAVGD